MLLYVLLLIVHASGSINTKIPLLITATMSSRKKHAGTFQELQSVLRSRIRALHIPRELHSILLADINVEVSFLYLKRAIDGFLAALNSKQSKSILRNLIKSLTQNHHNAVKALKAYSQVTESISALENIQVDFRGFFKTQLKMADEAIDGSFEIRRLLKESIQVVSDHKARFMTLHRSSISNFLATYVPALPLKEMHRGVVDIYQAAKNIQLLMLGHFLFIQSHKSQSTLAEIEDMRIKALLGQIYQTGIFIIFPTAIATFGAAVVYRSGTADPAARKAVDRMQELFVESIDDVTVMFGETEDGVKLYGSIIRFLRLQQSIDDIAAFI